MANPLLPVDLQVNAVNIACRLGSLIHFIEATLELKTCQNLSSDNFKYHSRKIVVLVEIARRTLIAAGIPLYLFSSCPLASVPYRAAYVDLLHILKERRNDVHTALEGRVKSLILPLSSGFKIVRRGDPIHSLNICPPGIKIQAVMEGHVPTTPPSSYISQTECHAPMPPPDLPPSIQSPTGQRQERTTSGSSPRGRRLWNFESSPSQYRSSRSPDLEQENEIPPPRLLRPLPRRFGIFCTSKTSMHRYRERAARPRLVRPLKE